MPVDLTPMKLPQLRLPALDSAVCALDYDADADWLRFSCGPGRPGTSVEKGDLWLRVALDTGEVFGFAVEDYVHHFLELHHHVRDLWRKVEGTLPQAPLTESGEDLAAAIWKTLPGAPVLRFKER